MSKSAGATYEREPPGRRYTLDLGDRQPAAEGYHCYPFRAPAGIELPVLARDEHRTRELDEWAVRSVT
jgi:hypothetical protein